mgnify:FL=1
MPVELSFGAAIALAFALGWLSRDAFRSWRHPAVTNPTLHAHNPNDATARLFVLIGRTMDELHPGWERVEIERIEHEGSAGVNAKIMVKGELLDPSGPTQPTKH